MTTIRSMPTTVEQFPVPFLNTQTAETTRRRRKLQSGLQESRDIGVFWVAHAALWTRCRASSRDQSAE
eukprot:5871519-Amphidinium_carterae.1